MGLEWTGGARTKPFAKPSSRLHCPLTTTHQLQRWADNRRHGRPQANGCGSSHVLAWAAAEHVWAEDRSRSPHLDSSAPSFACRAQHYSCGVVLGARSGVGRGQSLNAAMPDCLPAVISLIRRMLTTGELARREASRSDPERLVAFSRHNRLACDQSSRFWALPAAYRRDLLAPAAGEHAVLNPDRLIDVHSCCQSRTGSPGPRCATRQIVTFPLSTATHLPALATHLC